MNATKNMRQKEPLQAGASTADVSHEEPVHPVRPTAKQENLKRTAGNKVFDMLLYPSIAFGVVGAFSVWFVDQATFGKGWARNKFNQLQSTVGELYSKSGKLSATDIAKKSRGTTMMLVSFLAGTLLVMPIKWFEQYRSQFSHWYDEKFGTLAQDPRAYEQEPRQSYSSIAGGRALTFGVVLGVDQFTGKHIEDYTNSFAQKVSSKLETATKLSSAKITRWGQLAKIFSYEGFYTAVCATLLYVFSRGIAKIFNRKEDAKKQTKANSDASNTAVIAEVVPDKNAPESQLAAHDNYRQESAPKPQINVSSLENTSRIGTSTPAEHMATGL